MLLEVKNVSYRYNKSSPWILEDVSFTIDSKERVALVGPSGYGKSTLAKIISGYIKPEKGEVLWDGKALPKNIYCPIQMIYQHPEKSVNPRWKMAKILNEAWKVDNNILQEMGIEKSWFNRWPNELSGGELQRFCIARVLGPETKFLVCDEISTMLDVITQAQIWNFLLKISQENELGMLVVTHNIELANRVCDRLLELPKLMYRYKLKLKKRVIYKWEDNMSQSIYEINKSPRIQKLVDKLFEKLPEIESDRAVLLTESYKETEGQPIIVRRAKAFSHILKNIPIIIRENELIVGSATKAPRSCQVFPEFSYEWLEKEFDTVETRSADPFYISEDNKEILREVYKYWKGKTTSELATSYMADETIRAMEHNIFTPGNYYYN